MTPAMASAVPARRAGRTGRAVRWSLCRSWFLMACLSPRASKVEPVDAKDTDHRRIFPAFMLPGPTAPCRGPSPMEPPLDPARIGDHVDRLYRAAWALCGSREDAEDLVQETYARVLGRPRL